MIQSPAELDFVEKQKKKLFGEERNQYEIKRCEINVPEPVEHRETNLEKRLRHSPEMALQIESIWKALAHLKANGISLGVPPEAMLSELKKVWELYPDEE